MPLELLQNTAASTPKSTSHLTCRLNLKTSTCFVTNTVQRSIIVTGSTLSQSGSFNQHHFPPRKSKKVSSSSVKAVCVRFPDPFASGTQNAFHVRSTLGLKQRPHCTLTIVSGPPKAPSLSTRRPQQPLSLPLHAQSLPERLTAYSRLRQIIKQRPHFMCQELSQVRMRTIATSLPGNGMHDVHAYMHAACICMPCMTSWVNKVYMHAMAMHTCMCACHGSRPRQGRRRDAPAPQAAVKPAWT